MARTQRSARRGTEASICLRARRTASPATPALTLPMNFHNIGLVGNDPGRFAKLPVKISKRPHRSTVSSAAGGSNPKPKTIPIRPALSVPEVRRWAAPQACRFGESSLRKRTRLCRRRPRGLRCQLVATGIHPATQQNWPIKREGSFFNVYFAEAVLPFRLNRPLGGPDTNPVTFGMHFGVGFWNRFHKWLWVDPRGVTGTFREETFHPRIANCGVADTVAGYSISMSRVSCGKSET
jgi:hypothetical protein